MKRDIMIGFGFLSHVRRPLDETHFFDAFYLFAVCIDIQVKRRWSCFSSITSL